jgi:ABC-type proline/glycine betaine transport system ATPase subunit
METAIGVFDSRDRAEEALKDLLRHSVLQESIVFVTRSENEAVTVGRELDAYGEGFLREAAGTPTLITVPARACIRTGYWSNCAAWAWWRS